MSEPPDAPPIHSLSEAYLYARITPCPACAGPLDADEAWFDYRTDRQILTVQTACRQCEAPFERDFDASGVEQGEFAMLTAGPLAAPWNAPSQVLSTTPEASQVIDVAGWLTLCTLAGEQARLAADKPLDLHPPDRSAIRRLRLVAAACLDEALKFFDDDNDLPSDDAFFSDATRRQFWERPELFTRQHIADLRFSLMRGTM